MKGVVVCPIWILHVVLMFATHVHVLDSQELLITPIGDQVKKLNSRIIFKCSLVNYSPGDSPPEMTWIDAHDQPVDSSSGRMSVVKDGSSSLKLYISGIRRDDAGTYTCDVTAPNGVRVKESISLGIFEEIRFDPHPVYFKHQIGGSAFLECTASGQPQPTISWRFNRRKIPTDTAKYQYTDGGLRINDINPSDNGTYECRAEVDSQGNLKVRMITLDILFPPAITQGPESTTVIKGNDVSLECKARGNPPVQFDWYRERHDQSGMAQLKVKLSEDSDTLHIKAASEMDEGKYYCKVSNGLGTKEVSADVKLMIPPTMKDLPHKVVLENFLMMLVCEVSGIPPPEITWRRVGQSKDYVDGIQPNDARVEVDNTQQGLSKLIIRDVQRSYAGKFMCTAESEAGTVSKEGQLTVEYPPTVNSTGKRQHGWLGQVRNFTCSGRGSPLPTFSWYKGGQPVIDSDTYKIHNSWARSQITSTLQVTMKKQEDWVYGPYLCIAKNTNSHATETLYLIEAQTPGMPHDVEVNQETSTSVTLTAKKPKKHGGLPIESWHLKYEVTDEPDSTKEFYFTPKEKESFNREITDLEPGTSYTIFLAAGNQVGYGKQAKFNVETPKQADVPNSDIPERPETEDEEKKDSKDVVGGNSTVLQVKTGRGIHEPKQEEVKSGGGSQVGLAVGATIGLLLIIGVIVGFVLWRRRRTPEEPARKGSDLNIDRVTVDMNAAKDVDSIKMQIRRPSDKPPEVPPHRNLAKAKSPIEVRKTTQQGPTAMASMPKSPKQNRLSEEVPPTAVSCISNNPNSIQKQAWDSMLQTKAMADNPEEPEEPKPVNEATPMMDPDLPPPPAFLLENNENDAAQDDAASYQDILDGYHSEDNVDADSGYIDVRSADCSRASS